MVILDILEKIVTIVCSIISIIIAVIALCKSNEAIKQVNKIKIGNIEKKQDAINNTNSSIKQSIR